LAELTRVVKEKDAVIQSLQDEMDKLRTEKDAEIMRLDQRNEDRRIKDNSIYRECQTTIRKNETDIASYIKTIAVLTEELDIRKDFEKQYHEVLARCEALQEAKKGLQ
jgi:hypothetical protein